MALPDDQLAGARPPRGRALFWAIMVAVVALDVVTKRLAMARLQPLYVPHDVVGNVVRFTLTYNPGAAFGVNVGPASRILFIGLTAVALVVIARLYRATPPARTTRFVALGLVTGGAIGNLIDRFIHAAGVVDFIDVGLGNVRFWTFNVADSAVSIGAVILIWTLWNEDRAST